MAIAQLVDKITNAVEKDETTIGIFLDLFIHLLFIIFIYSILMITVNFCIN